MRNSYQKLLRLAGGGVVSIGLVTATQAAETILDFNTDQTGTTYQQYVAVGTDNPYTGNITLGWRPSGGASGGANDGYLAITDASISNRNLLVFEDLDGGLVVESFVFECDLRVGGGTAAPADGFSINYARDTDPAVTNPSAPLFAGTSEEASLPEEGTRTGLAIGFDLWQSGGGAPSGTMPGGLTDVVGISIRVDGALIAQLPLPLQPGNVYTTGTPTLYINNDDYRNIAPDHANYLMSMTTGARNLEDDLSQVPGVSGVQQVPWGWEGWDLWVKFLGWERFIAEVTNEGRVKITWKGVELTPEGGLASGFAASPGRIVFAGRTGGSYAAIHVDNIRLATVGATSLIIGAATGTPVGFTLGVIDSGPAIADLDTVEVTLDGVAVTPNSVTKDGINTTITYQDVTSPFVSGSTHTVGVTIKDTRGNEVTDTREFVVPTYMNLPPEYAVTGVNTAQRGFNFRLHQTATRNQENTVARAEQQLQGLRGDNVADLADQWGLGQMAFGTDGVYTETGVINYNQVNDAFEIEQSGFFTATAGAPANIADTRIPGIPSSTELLTTGYYTDNIAAEITTYLHFPEQGVYNIIFNSDDGFRTTTYNAVNEVVASLIVRQADVGKGASDELTTLYVAEAGYYPFRTVWFEGGGGASLEWSIQQTAPTVKPRYLINDNATDAVKAYRSRAAAPAAVTFVHPFRNSGNPYMPSTQIIVKIEDGATAVDQGSIALKLNGAAIASPAIAKAGTTTTVTANPPGAGWPGGNHTLTIEFTAGAQTYSADSTFQIRGWTTVPASLALPAGEVNTANRGFLVKTVQQDSGNGMGNETMRGRAQIDGLYGWPNVANLAAFTGPQGYYIETDVINYTQRNRDQVTAGTAVNTGYFTPANFGGSTDYANKDVPGIPSATAGADGGTDNYSQELLTVLDLAAGWHIMNVNSDDGFVTTVGNPLEGYTLPVVVGEFSGGRGQGGGVADGTTYLFYVAQAGLYPFRTIWYEAGGGSGAEWSVRALPDQNTGFGWATRDPRLINAGTAPVAYQYPLATAGSPYIKSFLPPRQGRGSTASPTRTGTDAIIKVVIVEALATLDTGAVTLRVNGDPVTANVTKANGEMTVQYVPTAPWAAGSVNQVSLTYGDRTVNWSFQVADMKTPTFFIEASDFNYGGGQTVAAASVMPYSGGAYAGLMPVHEVDYWRGDAVPDGNVYRVGETPNVPYSASGDRDRGVSELRVNFRMGWGGGNTWYNYTRTIPAGEYNVYAALSHGDAVTSATRMGGALDRVTGATTAAQTTERLGIFDAPSTGGWGNNALVPLKESAEATSILALALSGEQTLRFTSFNGDYDFLLFVPASDIVEQPVISVVILPNGNIQVSWTGGGQLQVSDRVDGGYTTVPGPTSPFEWAPDADIRFIRIIQ
jgi:hypothetical protein